MKIIRDEEFASSVKLEFELFELEKPPGLMGEPEFLAVGQDGGEEIAFSFSFLPPDGNQAAAGQDNPPPGSLAFFTQQLRDAPGDEEDSSEWDLLFGSFGDASYRFVQVLRRLWGIETDAPPPFIAPALGIEILEGDPADPELGAVKVRVLIPTPEGDGDTAGEAAPEVPQFFFTMDFAACRVQIAEKDPAFRPEILACFPAWRPLPDEGVHDPLRMMTELDYPMHATPPLHRPEPVELPPLPEHWSSRPINPRLSIYDDAPPALSEPGWIQIFGARTDEWDHQIYRIPADTPAEQIIRIFEVGTHDAGPLSRQKIIDLVATRIAQVLEIIPGTIYFADSAGLKIRFHRQITPEELARIEALYDPDEWITAGLDGYLSEWEQDGPLLQRVLEENALCLWWD